MTSHAYKVGDHVRWNSDVGHVTGKVVEVHTSDFEFMGKHRPCSQDEPQFEVKSDNTGNHAVHHGSALRRHSD